CKIVGGHKYVIPRGWIRFGLKVNRQFATSNNIWNEWSTSFHGTSVSMAKSSYEKNRLTEKDQFYSSPTIKYSEKFSSKTIFTSSNNKQYRIKLVFECKQKPDTFQIQKETVGSTTKRICAHIPNNEIKWYSDTLSSVVICGLLVHMNAITDKCSYSLLCEQFIDSLKWEQELFNKDYNKCYCNKCYLDTWLRTYTVGELKCVLPRGWMRFGVRIDETFVRIHDIWKNWANTYHGTSVTAAKSILVHRQFLLPGDTLLDGRKLEIHREHIPGMNHFYTSPTIKYSSLSTYCPKIQFTSANGEKYDVRVVLQCKQKPGTFKIQRETVGYGTTPICEYISNEEIEWYSESRASIIVFGVLVHIEKIV
ncbi:unnamed protein product, partial [Didymodactylos carnosus]